MNRYIKKEENKVKVNLTKQEIKNISEVLLKKVEKQKSIGQICKSKSEEIGTTECSEKITIRKNIVSFHSCYPIKFCSDLYKYSLDFIVPDYLPFILRVYLYINNITQDLDQ